MTLTTDLESPKFAQRVRTSLILLMVLGVTLFLSAMPKLPLVKQLPWLLGWPCALYACWSLCSYSKAAKTAMIPVAGIVLISILRSFLPVQLAVSLTEPLRQISVPLVIVATCLSVAREVLIVVGFIYLGRLTTEMAEPVESLADDELPEKTKRDFYRLVIGWSVAAIWTYVFLAVFVVTMVNESAFLTRLPSIVQRLVIAGPRIIKVIVTWNVVLVLYQVQICWQALCSELLTRFSEE